MLALPTKYALKALTILGSEDSESYIQVRLLAERAEVPGPYLSKIMKELSSKGIVQSKKGVTGGVRLYPTSKPFTFYDVCIALNDPIISQSCFMSRHPCNSGMPCIMHKRWGLMKRHIIKQLQATRIS